MRAIRQFSRGSEATAHLLQSLLSSLRWQAAAALLVGSVLGSLWYVSLTLDPTALRALPDYLYASFMTGTPIFRTASYTISAEQLQLPHAEAYARLRAEVLGHRDMGFLVWQWLSRCLISGCLGAFVVVGLTALYGSRLDGTIHRRGSRLWDATKTNRYAAGREVLTSAFLSGVCALLMLVPTFGSRPLVMLPELLQAWLTTRSGALAAMFGPEGASHLGWYSVAAAPGFYENAKVLAAMQESSWVAPGRIFGLFFALWLLMFVVHRRAKARRDSKSPRPQGFRIAGVELPSGAECSHFLITGTTGAGKSQALMDLLEQIRAKNQRAIVYDNSGELVSYFYRPGKDVLLNPLDARSAAWSPWADGTEFFELMRIGESLFPPEKGVSRFWATAPATLFATTAHELGKRGQMEVRKLCDLLLRGSQTDLCDFLRGTAAARYVDGAASEMTQSVLAVLSSKMASWETLPSVRVDQAFSIRRFIEEDSERWLFLPVKESQTSLLRPLVSLWFDVATSSISGLPPTHHLAPERQRRVWLILDEVASLEHLPSLEFFLTNCRKFGGCAVLGLQMISQLRERYGHDTAATIAGMPQTRLTLRISEAEMAEWASRSLGQIEIEEQKHGISMGMDSKRDGISMQQARSVESLVLASEIQALQDLEGFLRLPGSNVVRRVRYPHRARVPNQPGYVQRQAVA